MLLCDVNVLVYAHLPGAERHREYLDWLTEALDSDAAFGVSELVLSSVVRIVTHPRIAESPSTLQEAFAFADTLREAPNAVPLAPGPRHWGIFAQLCYAADTKGNLVTDAYLAALAIESGSEWISTDRDFARFAGLRWRHPLER